MNQRFDPSDRPVNPTAWPADTVGQRIDPVTSQPVNDPLLNQRRPEEVEVRSSRSTWPVLIVLLAGLVLALLVWLPAEMSSDQPTDTATPPATTDQTTTAPADNAIPPADNSATPGTATPDTSATPNATPATPDTQTPATGADQQPQTNGMAPQTNETAPAN